MANPVANNTAGSGAEDATVPARIAITLSGTDADGAGTIAQFLIQSAATNGQLFDASTGGTLLGAGSAVTASGDQAIVYFQPDADWNGLTSFTYNAQGSDTNLSADATAEITVTAVNDAPTVINGNTENLATISEDTVPAGDTIANLFGAHFSDAADQVAGGSSANTFAGIAIINNAATAAQGSWQWSVNGINWNTITTPSQSNSLTLSAALHLRFLPAANYNGAAPSLTAHLVDNSQTFTSGAIVNLSGVGATGGATQYSSATIALGETVDAVNDPIGTVAPGAVSLAEDAVNFAVTGMSITDVDATLAPAGVYEVTLTATHGLLTLTTLAGLTFTAGDGTSDATMTFHGTLADINTALGTAKYSPDANYNGSAQISFQATDTFGGVVATGSGAATSDSNTINVTVTAVNDPVTGAAPAAASTAEDTAVAIGDVDCGRRRGARSQRCL
jgi:hypothetical protein